MSIKPHLYTENEKETQDPSKSETFKLILFYKSTNRVEQEKTSELKGS